MRGRFFRIGGLAAWVLLAAGCAGNGLTLRVPDTKQPGQVRYYVLGFGIIKVTAPKATAATVIQSRTLGLQVGDSPAPRLTVGYSASHTTLVPAEAEIVLEVEQKPFHAPEVTLVPVKSTPKPGSVSHAHDTPTTQPSPGG